MPININGSGSAFIPENTPKKEPIQNKGLLNTTNKLGLIANENPKPLKSKVTASPVNGSKQWKIENVSQKLLTDQHEHHLSLSNQVIPPKLLKQSKGK